MMKRNVVTVNETTKDETWRTAKRRNELSIGDGKKSSIRSPSRELSPPFEEIRRRRK